MEGVATHDFISPKFIITVLGLHMEEVEGGCETGEGDILYPKKISLSLFFGCCGFFT